MQKSPKGKQPQQNLSHTAKNQKTALNFDDDLKFHKLYPKAIDMTILSQKINKPLESYSMKFKQPGMVVLSEMINTRVIEESVSESPFKKHIIKKYIEVNRENSLLASRTKLDSLRFNYQFGIKEIDENHKLKAFMTKNIEKRMFKRTPLNHELQMLTEMVKDKQKENLLKYSIQDVVDEQYTNPQQFLEDLSPQYKIMEKIKDQLTRYKRNKSYEPNGTKSTQNQDESINLLQQAKSRTNNLYNENNKQKRHSPDEKFLQQQAVRYPFIKQILEKKQMRQQMLQEQISQLNLSVSDQTIPSQFQTYDHYQQQNQSRNNNLNHMNSTVSQLRAKSFNNRGDYQGQDKFNSSFVNTLSTQNNANGLDYIENSGDFQQNYQPHSYSTLMNHNKRNSPKIINLTESLNNLTNSYKNEVFQEGVRSMITRDAHHKNKQSESSNHSTFRSKSQIGQYTNQLQYNSQQSQLNIANQPNLTQSVVIVQADSNIQGNQFTINNANIQQNQLRQLQNAANISMPRLQNQSSIRRQQTFHLEPLNMMSNNRSRQLDHIQMVINQGYDKKLQVLMDKSRKKFQGMKRRMDDINNHASNTGESPGANKFDFLI
eukprot:403365487